MENQVYVNLLMDLMRCRAVSSDKEAVNKASAKLMEFLQAQGIYCVVEECDGYQVVYAATAPGKSAELLFNAHIDVVPAMTEEQYTPFIKDGVLYGRGSSDCLGSAVCLVKMLVDLKGTNASAGVIFTCNEEVGGSTTRAMVEKGYGAGAKLISVIDSDAYKIAIFQKGIVSINVTAHGTTGHSSRPWAFTNAIDVLIDAYTKLRNEWPKPDMNSDLYKYNSMAACQFHAGHAHNQIPDTAQMTLNFRVTQDGDVEKVLDYVKRTTGLDVSIIETCPPVSCDENEPMLQNLKAEMQEHFAGHEIEFTKMFGATDARHFRSLNKPIAILGLSGGGAHSAGEFLPLENMFDTTDFLVKYAVKHSQK